MQDKKIVPQHGKSSITNKKFHNKKKKHGKSVIQKKFHNMEQVSYHEKVPTQTQSLKNYKIKSNYDVIA